MTDQLGTTPLPSGAKAELLERWLRGEPGPPATGSAAIRPRAVPGPAALSLAQQRLWFIEQLQPGTAAYNLSFCGRVGQELDPELLRRCVDELVDRHEALRTVVRVENGTPVGVLDGAARPALQVVDLRELGRDDAPTEAVRRVQAAADAPFELERGPLARILLCRVRGGDVLGVVVHHLAADGWSLSVALAELSAAYQAYAAGGRPVPGPLPIQYADYAAWQAEQADIGGWADDIAYWRQQLADAPALDLPTDRPRPAVVGAAGGWVELRLPRELSDAIRDLARDVDATPFMVLLAAWQTLLAKLSGQSDVSVGANVANRTRPETYPLIGNFVSVLTLRTSLALDPTFRELVARARRTCLAAFAHQSVPFEQVVREIQPERDLSRGALFQALFVLQPPMPEPRFAGAPVEVVEVAAHSARADLELHLRDYPEMIGHVSYSGDLFDAETVDRLTVRFLSLLQRAVADPDQPLSALSLVTADERRWLADTSSGTPVDLPAEPVHRLIARQAARTPTAIAVVSGPVRLDYGSVDQRANQLAHHLRELGVGPEERVAVCLDRSAETVVAVLGVLKAGGAYVPLDPRNPVERLRVLVADAGARVVLTQDSLAASFTGRTTVVRLDRDAAALDARPRTDPAVEVHPENLAYVVYTSGSTGTPKGVAVPHRSLANIVEAVRNEQGIGPNDVMAMVSSLAFDASVAELFPVLTAGGALVVASMDQIMDGNLLRRLVLTHRITALLATPTTWRMLVTAGGLGLPKVKALSGAEALPPDLAEVLATSHDQAWNLYGPTETVAWTTADRLVPGRPVSLGRPVPNSRLLLLDDELELVPPGVTAEICIGGLGVTRGYLDEPALTAERFVPDPVGRPGGRLYRTGDLARHRPDGSLEYRGRRDDQVKLRGHRIEPGEIEVALREHPSVDQAAVVLDSDAGSPRLVAYVVRRQVATDAERRDARPLLRYLRGRLPEYAVPATVVVLDQLPLTSGGKLDRRRLPRPDRGRASARPHVPPRSALEEEIVQVAEEFLNVDDVGVFDNFFDLGGHSLLVARLVDRLRRRYGIELLLQDLFLREPTVEQLAALVDEQVRRKRQLASETDRMRRHVEELPDATVDALLEQLVAERRQEPHPH